ncbi:MAG: DNA-protecting protein DprA [Ruminococcaceae bacterium]|nr:DNA-protecting protein DprA [Oscillospiraceae bacterium]
MIDVLYWLWMSGFCRPGAKTADYLLEAFGSPDKLFNASDDEIKALKLDEGIKETILARDMKEAEQLQSFCIQHNIGLLPYDCDLFPDLLRKIEKKPILFYYRGNLPDFRNNLTISVVGTRKCSDYGTRNTYTLSYDLAKAGAIVVSGMANGIDRQAHLGALDAGGKTVAILGSGINVIYPRSNHDLYNNIARFGTVLSEFKPGTPALGFNFPVRNRLISGISRGTVVIEADLKSGAMITAHTADSQGRDIFALPGEVGESNSRGTNSLIRDGAKIVLKTHDILDCYEKDYPESLIPSRIGDCIPQTKQADPYDRAGFYKVAAPTDAFDTSRPLREEKIEYTPIVRDEKMNITVLPPEEKIIRTRQRPLSELPPDPFVELMRETDPKRYAQDTETGGSLPIDFIPAAEDKSIYETMSVFDRADAERKSFSRPPTDWVSEKPTDADHPFFDLTQPSGKRKGEAFAPREPDPTPETVAPAPAKKKKRRDSLLVNDLPSHAVPKELPRPDPSLLQGYERQIYDFMQYGTEYHVDSLHDAMGDSEHTVTDLLNTLFILEIKNYVIMYPGKVFFKN